MPNASKKIVAKIRTAAKAGRIGLANPTPERQAAFTSLNAAIQVAKTTKKPLKVDLTLTGAKLESTWSKWRKKVKGKIFGNDGGFEISWSTVSAGFGGLTFYIKDGKLHCETEGMGKKFIVKVLVKLVEDTILE